MANVKEIVHRINSTNFIQQITNAMKVVAASNLNKAQQQVLQIRLYANQLTTVLGDITATAEQQSTQIYTKERQVKKLLLVVISSDKGLCGSFNSNVFRKALNYAQEPMHNLAPGQIDILPIGKKALNFFEKRTFALIKEYVGLSQLLNFEQASKAATFLIDSFLQLTYDRVVLIYNEFKSVATQVVVAKQFLPIIELNLNQAKREMQTKHLYEPSRAALIETLTPQSLKILFYKALLESNASEHGTRMMAMGKATDNANDLLKTLRLSYNRSRQTIITREISEIAAGAEALPS